MKANKHIKRGDGAAKFFNQRSLDRDYRHLRSFLNTGMNILDVGCGTGALSGEMAQIVGAQGSVTGIDNTEKFILNGQATFGDIPNLRLVHADLFAFAPSTRFDLITSARTLQWLSDPQQALLKMRSLLKPGGRISILDYNHEDLDWQPEPPASMRSFYDCFLRWRADAGMNNRIAEDLPQMLARAGFTSIEVLNSDERYTRERPDFKTRVGIWSQVAGSTQMVEEGYLDDELRLRAIAEYDRWVEQEAVSMTMKLNEVRAQI
jgi:ubiquinone/menaquinone biosynthesis C-methylase UbiE